MTMGDRAVRARSILGGATGKPALDLSVVIVDYHSLGLLEGCIASLRRSTQPLSCEIIVSSNSVYSNEEERQLQHVLADATLIRNGRNLGFAKAANIGIRESSGRWILLLNPDCRILTPNPDKAIRYLEENPEIGILGPRIVNAENEVQESHRQFTTPSALLFRVLKRFVRKERYIVQDIMSNGKAQFVDWVSGACMLVRRSGIQKAGLLDERYFMYLEDTDWCRTFWKNGLQVVYWPEMVVRHDASRVSSESLAEGSLNRLVWIHLASWIKFFVKHGFSAQRRLD